MTLPTQPNFGYSEWFFLVTAACVTCLITANITAVKLLGMPSLVLPVAVIIFPISYILGDVWTGVYGYRQARQVIWSGLSCNITVVVTIWLAQMLLAPLFRDDQETRDYIRTISPDCWLPHYLPTLRASLPTPLCWPRQRPPRADADYGRTLSAQRYWGGD